MSAAPRVVVIDVDELDRRIEAAVKRALAAVPQQEAEWLDVVEAAALLGIHRRTVARLAKSDGLPAHRLGKLYRFRRDELTAWLVRRKVG